MIFFKIFRVTNFMAIDCEMNEGENRNIPCKVTIVNMKGELVLDTLIYNDDQAIKKSHSKIHGIDEELLQNAPTFTEVRNHILKISNDCIFVGHSTK